MNWIEAIALLKEAGYKQGEIASACGCAQATISDLATGKTKDTSDSIGQVLRTLIKRAERKLAQQKARA